MAIEIVDLPTKNGDFPQQQTLDRENVIWTPFNLDLATPLKRGQPLSTINHY
jgi:hypothetical protein